MINAHNQVVLTVANEKKKMYEITLTIYITCHPTHFKLFLFVMNCCIATSPGAQVAVTGHRYDTGFQASRYTNIHDK